MDDGMEILSGRKWRATLDEIIDLEREGFGGLGPFERWKVRAKTSEKMRRAFDFVDLGLARPHGGRIIPVMQGGAQSPFGSPVGQPVAAPSSFTPVASTNVETNLWVPGIWAPIPANDPTAGKVYEHKCAGIFSTSSAAPTSLWTPRVGQSATPSSNITMGASTASTMIASLASVPFFSLFNFTIRALGLAASGATATGGGFVCLGGLTTAVGVTQAIGGTVATTVDNTAAIGYILSQTWGTTQAANTLTAQMVSPVISLN